MKEASPLSHNSSALLGTPSKVGLRQGLACEQRVMPYPPPAQGQVTRAQEAEENYVIKRELAVVRQQCSSATEDLQKAQSTIRQLQEQQVPAGHRGEATLQPPAWQHCLDSPATAWGSALQFLTGWVGRAPRAQCILSPTPTLSSQPLTRGSILLFPCSTTLGGAWQGPLPGTGIRP